MDDLRAMTRDTLQELLEAQPPSYEPDDRTEAILRALRWVCSQCGKPDADERYDRYGIYAGKMCGLCWDATGIADWVFDAGYAGECLEPEDY